jgi:hypothetical protein
VAAHGRSRSADDPADPQLRTCKANWVAIAAETWALEQKAAADRQVIAIMRQRLAAGEEVARMYQEPALAWLDRQAEVAEDLGRVSKVGGRVRCFRHGTR